MSHDARKDEATEAAEDGGPNHANRTTYLKFHVPLFPFYLSLVIAQERRGRRWGLSEPGVSSVVKRRLVVGGGGKLGGGGGGGVPVKV